MPTPFHWPCVDTGFACIAGPQPNNSRCLRLITTECARDHKGDSFGKQSDILKFLLQIPAWRNKSNKSKVGAL